MTTERDVHSAVVRWVALVSGLTVIKAHQGGARPDKPYIMVNHIATRDVREHKQRTDWDEDTAGDEVTASPVIETEWQFSLHAYGDDPMDTLRTIRSATHLAQMQEPLLPAYAINETGPINSVPDFINEAWEPRAQMNLFLRGLTRDGFVVDVIEQASVDFDRMA